MRITESKLRRIIRNILAEGYAESGELGDSEDIPHGTDTHGGSLDDALSMSDEYTDLDSEYDTRNDKKRYRPRRKTNPDINW
jgi:hypothetical protein